MAWTKTGKLEKSTAKKQEYLKYYHSTGKPKTYAQWMREHETEPAYFKGIRTPTVESQLRKGGITEKELRSLGVGLKRKKRGK